jgi:hypothetical protein
MSSFICSNKHFNSVEFALQLLLVSRTNQFHSPAAFREKMPNLYYKEDFASIDADITRMVDHLRRLSALCVTLQYAHHYPGEVDTQIKLKTDDLLRHKKEHIKLTPLGLYNALNCIEYQIETSHLVELRPLTGDEELALLFLSTMIQSLGEYIIRQLPEDQTCHWEIS